MQRSLGLMYRPLVRLDPPPSEGSVAMFHLTSPSTERRFRLSRTLALPALGLLLVALIGLKVFLPPSTAQSAASVKPAAAPVVDRRLILHAHSTRVSGWLAGGLHLAGTLYPTLPGPNVLRVAVVAQHLAPVRGSRVEVVATMPGMAMRPARATLVPCAAGYCGSLTLPMFGRYQVQTVIATPSGRLTGSLGIELPLPIG